MPKKVQKKIVWKGIIGLVGAPNGNNREGMRQYQKLNRQVDKKIEDPKFINEFDACRKSFIEFLKSSNLGPYPPLQEFLNRDMSSFLVKKKKKAV